MIPREKVDFCTAMKNCCMNYVNFEGRIRRSEYWWFMLVINSITLFLLLFLIMSICGCFRIRTYYNDGSSSYDGSSSIVYHSSDKSFKPMISVFLIYVFSVTLPTLGATVRRLHDVGRQGETIFMGLIPLGGGIALLYLLCSDSMKESNEYGPSTKYANTDLKEEINEKDISQTIN